MKKIFTLFTLFFLMMMGMVDGQTHLWGTCTQGGTTGHGTIFTTDVNGNNFNTVYSFDSINGAWPYGNIVLAPNGKIYGITAESINYSVLFEYDPVSHINNRVFNFGGWSSAPSIEGMILGDDGNLYGLRDMGGIYWGGLLYRFNPLTHVFDTLFNFNGPTGYNPCSKLLLVNNNLYGTTTNGGAGTGVIFSFDLSTSSYTIVHSFDSNTCSGHEYGNLILGTDGKLYGASRLGGNANQGFIFNYDISTNTFNELYDFSYSSFQGYDPQGGLMQASDGKLYGMTNAGGLNGWGVIYSFDISNSIYTDIHDFNDTDGIRQYRKLMQASNGLLFGVRDGGITYNNGSLFSYNITTNTYIDLYNFNNDINGIWPDATLLEIPDYITTGFIQTINKQEITIYPNPATSTLTLHSQFSILNSQLIITDVLGNEVYHQLITHNSSLITQINISQWSDGVYFYEVQSGSGLQIPTSMRGKFVKQ